MSDDAQTPDAPGDEPRDHPEDARPGTGVPLDKAPAEPNPWAPPADAGPFPPSVHDRQTVTPFPGAGTPPPPGAGYPAGPPAWTNPSAAAPGATPADPFAPPAAPAQGNPFAPPGAPYPAQYPAAGGPPSDLPGDPFAPPAGPYPQPHPHAHPAPGSPVPPPPIAPGGPGEVPYGYGYPGYPGYGGQGAAYGTGPGGPGYGWPGMPMMPSNGLGTAGLVLGIIAAVGFCLWPVALACGVLAVIFGAIGRGKARRGEATNPGQALAGIICGAVGIALAIAFVVVFLAIPGESDRGGWETTDDGYSAALAVNG
ncbi:hypothetical protein ACFUTV_31465 [Streptomyces sp. NPDC057298]|uniref:DUF4190 domain-containing protein n=1 Tax=Streptomyces sp. NPDC057298 TaxID=3346091 RepID=UPI00363A660F